MLRQTCSSNAPRPATQPQPGEAGAELRLRRPNREGVLAIPAHVDGLLPADHQARQVWAIVTQLDLSAFYAEEATDFAQAAVAQAIASGEAADGEAW